MSAFLAFRPAACSVVRSQRPCTNLLRKTSFVHIPIRGLAKARTFPINGQIPHTVVQVLDADGTLHHAHKLSRLLDSIDKTTHLVRLISHDPPIVRVMTHLEDQMGKLERKAEKKASKRPGKLATKEVKLSWLTSDADYDHKMAKAKEELAKGDIRVDVVFTPKRGVRSPSPVEMQEQMQKVADAFADVSNEWKERDIFKGGAKLFLQSIVRPPKVLPTKEEIEEMAKRDLEKRERTLKHAKKADS